MDVIDVAIIGAGVSGAYCAHRLTADTARTVEVFESNDRVGGRLWSHRWPEADALVELGGEAFSPIHANVAGLVRSLGLTAVPHREFSTLNRLYLRDRLVGMDDLLHRSSFPQAAGAAAKLRYFVPDDYLATMPAPGAGPAGLSPDDIDDPFTFLGSHILKFLSPDVQDAFGALCEGYARRVAEITAGGPLTAATAIGMMTPALYEALGALISGLERARIHVSPATARILGEDEVPLHAFDFWSVVVRDFGQEVYELYRGAGYDNTSALYYNMQELFGNLLIGALFGMANPG
jgi:phytoene dehydrogenase-like protein